jgi:hypothetical protein
MSKNIIFLLKVILLWICWTIIKLSASINITQNIRPPSSSVTALTLIYVDRRHPIDYSLSCLNFKSTRYSTLLGKTIFRTLVPVHQKTSRKISLPESMEDDQD